MTGMEIVMSVGLWASTCLLGLCCKFIWDMKQQTNELWDIHLGPVAMDENRSPKWYVKSSLESTIKELTEAIDEDKEAHRKLRDGQKEIIRRIKAANED